MSKFEVKAIPNKIAVFSRKHSPEILMGIGIAGMITTVVSAVRATPKALKLMNNEVKIRSENNEFLDDDGNIVGLVKMGNNEGFDIDYRLPRKDAVKLVWKCYIPTTVTGILSIVCLISSNSVSSKRNTALATAYTLSESAFKEYSKKVIETIGEKKEQTLKESIVKDKIDKNPVSKNEVIITEKGNTLCYDVLSKRYFRSDIDKLRKAENELNRMLLDEMYVSLNDLYYEFGLECIPIGDDIGWNVDDGYIELDFSSHLADDGTPCLAVDYYTAPRYDYMPNR